MRPHPLAAWLVALLAAALLLTGCGGGDEAAKDSDPKRDAPARSDSTHDAGGGAGPLFKIAVEGGVVKGGPRSLRVDKGDRVMIQITSDSEDEVHLHGIDIEADVAPRRQGTLEFTAKDQGSYELELHEAGTVLGAVVVS